jgi:predicted peroxiredoxin
MDLEPTIFFLGEGITVAKKGEAEKIQEGTFPKLREVMDEAVKAGAKLLVCQESGRVFGEELKPENFVDGCKIVGAATLNDLALEAEGVMWF